MDPNRLRTMQAPAMAGLFVILLLCFLAVRRPVSEGLQLPLYPLHPEPHPSGECNARAIVLWLTQDGKMWINDTETEPSDLRPKLEEIYEWRSKRRAYAVVDSGVSVQQFADFMSRIVGVSPKLDVVLLSGDLRHEVEQGPTFDGLCGLWSPEAGSPFVQPTTIRH